MSCWLALNQKKLELIIGLHFYKQETQIYLYLVSFSSIHSLCITNKEEAVLVGEQGCDVGTSLLAPAEYPPELVTARKEVSFSILIAIRCISCFCFFLNNGYIIRHYIFMVQKEEDLVLLWEVRFFDYFFF